LRWGIKISTLNCFQYLLLGNSISEKTNWSKSIYLSATSNRVIMEQILNCKLVVNITKNRISILWVTNQQREQFLKRKRIMRLRMTVKWKSSTREWTDKWVKINLFKMSYQMKQRVFCQTITQGLDKATKEMVRTITLHLHQL